MNVGQRLRIEQIVQSVCLMTTLAAVGILFLIIIEIFTNGLPSLSLYFIMTPENATPGMGQGIANAIAGTIIISLCATILAAPFGFGTAVYMKRYAKDSGITRAFRFLLEVLSGTPSIVLGVFGFLVFVIYMKKITGGFSLIAGSLALAILIMPVIERAIEDAIDRVPWELEEGSYALGANKWQTIWGVTVPSAFSGILTGFTLAFGRAAEESAIVVLTAGYTQYMPEFAIHAGSDAIGTLKAYPFQDQVATLPYTVYHAFQNQVMVKPSSGFAAAFVLIMIVLIINIAGRMLLERTMNTGKRGTSFIGMIHEKLSAGKKRSDMEPGIEKESPYKMNSGIQEPTDQPDTSPKTGDQPATPLTETKKQGWSGISLAEGKVESSIMEKILQIEPDASPQTGDQPATPLTEIKEQGGPGDSQEERKADPGIPQQSNGAETVSGTPSLPIKTFLRTLLSFAIPAALLLLIAFLATIPPLHHALGTASPFLAGVFAIGLSLIIIVAGTILALLVAKKSGAFKKKTRRTGYAAVITGFCLVCIAGIICASSAAGVFSTGTEPAKTATGDRNAQLAALVAAGEPGSGGSEVQVQELPAQAPATPAPAQGNDTIVSVPRKNALSVGESYSWGDAEHTCRATVYDYKVLPFYFWWWIDYNRFVQQVPAFNKSYLVVFVRIENTGTQSAVIPSADNFNVSYHASSYGRLPYLNSSLISDFQHNELGLGSSENLHEQYYQWIREIGQNKRDYAYLTGENLFGNFNSTSVTDTTSNSTTLTTTSSTGSYNGAYLKPGRSQAVDGYLIYEVPTEATTHLNETYVDVSFNSLSNGRWKLG
jgi:phosphate transport system permease protein